MKYKDELEKAIERSYKLGISKPSISFCSECRYSEDRLMELIAIIENTYNGITMERLFGKCIQVHFDFLEDIRRIFHSEALLTIGYIRSGDSVFFEFDESDIDNWFTNGVDKQKVNLHVWITLPSLEIIDLTFPATYSYVKKIKAFGILIFRHVSELEGMSYPPMLASEETACKLGSLKSIELTI